MQASFQGVQLLLESFSFDFEIRRCLRDAEFLCIQFDDMGRMVCSAVGSSQFMLLRLLRRQLS